MPRSSLLVRCGVAAACAALLAGSALASDPRRHDYPVAAGDTDLPPIREIVNRFVLPALDNEDHAALTAARKRALLDEPDLAARTAGKPGAPVDPTDTLKL